jgi:hypothetical protein
MFTDARAASQPGSWQQLSLVPGSVTTQVVSVAQIKTVDGSTSWVIGGATAAAPPERQPAVWLTSDLKSFTAVTMKPNEGYGQIAEMFGVASTGMTDDNGADDNADIAAIGQAFGGAHGNPRTASWDGNATALSEVRTNFELYNGPRQIAVKAITVLNTAATKGYVIFGSRVNQNGRLGAASWFSPDGSDFVLVDNDPQLSSAPNEQVQALDVITGPQGEAIGAGERLWWDPANSADTIDTDAMLWRSDDGKSWQRWNPPGFNLGGPGEQRIQKIAVHNNEVAAAGTETRNGLTKVVFWEPGGKKTEITALGSSDDPLSTVTTLARVGARWFVGARIGGVLRLAAFTDASGNTENRKNTKNRKNTWTKVDLPKSLPSGGRARLIVFSDTGSLLVAGAAGLNGGGLWSRKLTAG